MRSFLLSVIIASFAVGCGSGPVTQVADEEQEAREAAEEAAFLAEEAAAGEATP